MTLWDSRFADEKVEDRLKRLSWMQLAAYSIACVTHAYHQIMSEIADARQEHLPKIGHLLDRFWSLFPSGLENAAIQPLAKEAASLVPEDEGGHALPWEDTLIWGLAYAFSVVSRGRLGSEAVEEAIASSDRSYVSVYLFSHERVETAPSLQDVRIIELTSTACLREIAFQLSLLRVIESIAGPLPSYPELLRLAK